MRIQGDSISPDKILKEYLPSSIAVHMPEKLCEKLARSHYENFTVGSVLLPKDIRQHFYNIYAYCRVCDDLADETGDPELSIHLLQWWQDELHKCYNGDTENPIFQALKTTVDKFELPIKPFEDLIDAFVQDQQVTRYETYPDLLHYCERSANPVGRLVLALLGYKDETRQRLSDHICTALQLANFWQDIAVDYKKGRVYIPKEDMVRFGYTELELKNHVLNASFVRLMRFEIARTRELFESGQPLHGMISGIGAADVKLFSDGGLSLLQAIEKNNFDIFNKRITVSKSRKTMMLAGWCFKRLVHWHK